MYWLPFFAPFLDCWRPFEWPKLLILKKIHQYCKIIDISIIYGIYGLTGDASENAVGAPQRSFPFHTPCYTATGRDLFCQTLFGLRI